MALPELPNFRYHPDPVATGSVQRSDARCSSCGLSRGWIYSGPIFAVADDPAFCPWCIADGRAADRFDALFTDVGVDVPAEVPPGVISEVARRTPGFHGWQQEHWLYHCSDAAAFIGRAGSRDLADHPDAREMLLHENDEFGWSPEQSALYVSSLQREGAPTAYLFRCLVCGRDLAYSDYD